MDTTEHDYFAILPPEILYQIFDLCELSDQLILSRICNNFYHVIKEIYKKKYKFINYTPSNFKTTQRELTESEIKEFCRLCAESVERIHLQTYFLSRWCNYDEDEKKRFDKLQQGFRHNIQYFTNLQELEINGNTFKDETILDLAKCCKKLNVINFRDIEINKFEGKYLYELENIECLRLRNCHYLDTNYLLAVSKKRHLKLLDIQGCYGLYDLPSFLILTNHWIYLRTLEIFAFTGDPLFLKAITDLPLLETLKINWNTSEYSALPNFEEQIFQALHEHKEKSVKLKYIQFTNESLMDDYEENKSHALKKEQFYARTASPKWSEKTFKKIALSFKNFSNLQTINLHYSRLMSNKQLMVLVKLNPQIKLIKIDGCPKSDDEDFKKDWSKLKSLETCQLELNNILTLAEVKQIHDESSEPSNLYLDSPIIVLKFI